MGLLDKIKGNHGDSTHSSAGTVYDKGDTKHHGVHGTTHSTNATGAAYGEPATTTGLPGQEPYATHGGLPGTHDGDQYNTTPGHHGLTGSHAHERRDLPGGAAGYGGQDPGAPGVYSRDGLPQPGGTYGDSNTHSSGLTGHRDGHGSHEKGGLLGGRKKDDLEESLSREQKAKAELDAALAKHEEARKHADRQLNEKEQAAQAELRAAEERLREAQETRRKAGH